MDFIYYPMIVVGVLGLYTLGAHYCRVNYRRQVAIPEYRRYSDEIKANAGLKNLAAFFWLFSPVWVPVVFVGHIGTVGVTLLGNLLTHGINEAE